MRPAGLALALVLTPLGCGGDDGSAGETEAPTTSAASGSGPGTSADEGSETVTADATGNPGAGWQVVAELGVERGMAMSVFGASASEVRVAGGQRSAEGSTGFMLLRAAETWEPEPLPADVPMLNWVGRAGDDLWAVGLDGAALRLEDGAWVSHVTPTDVTLWGVWGSGVDDLWAVGGDGVGEAPTLLRFDGTAWSMEALPALSPDAHALFKVWGWDAEHVYVAGDHGIVMRRSGGSWEATELGSIAPMIALWGGGADEVVAVGGRSNARIARWDGASWQDATLDEPGLNGVWLDSSGTATLVGRLGGIFELPPGSLEPRGEQPVTNLLLHAVHGFDDGSRIAVGGSFEGAPPWVGVILEHPG